MFSRFFFCLCFIFCVSPLAVAASSDPLVGKLQQKYNAISSMEAKFSQIIIHKESGAKEQRTGTFLFKKPLLVRWEAEKPTQELLVVNSSAIWNVFPDEEVAYKYPASMVHSTHNIFQVITGRSKLDQDFDVENKGLENKLVKLHLFPKQPVQSLVEAVFWVNPETALIQKVRITDFYGNHNDITFTSHKLGVSLSDSQFTYVPAKGIIVEDRTKDPSGLEKNFLQ